MAGHVARKKACGTLTGVWIPNGTRDQIVDFARSTNAARRSRFSTTSRVSDLPSVPSDPNVSWFQT